MPDESGDAMRLIDLLKALVDLPEVLLREACRFNPDADVVTEGCDCWGEVKWVSQEKIGLVLARTIPEPRPSLPLTWFTRDGKRVPYTHPEAFVEADDEWIAIFEGPKEG